MSAQSMKAAILTVGSEITTGQIADTNARWVADELTRIGIDVRLKLSVDDERSAIQDAWRIARARAEIVWVTGGMGVTLDDLAVEVLAEVIGRKLVKDEGVERRVAEAYERRHASPPPSAGRQALVPEGAEILPNPVGLAPGVMLEDDGVILIMLPGVPAEMIAIAKESVLPRLRSRGGPFDQRVLRVTGMPEGLVDERIRGIWTALPSDERLALQAIPGEVLVRISAKAGSMRESTGKLDVLEERIRQALGHEAAAVSGVTLEERVIMSLKESGRTVAVAESVTGGLICFRLSAVPGASDVLWGGWIAYRNESKTGMLGIPAKLIRDHGAVSTATAEAMAREARKRTGAILAVSTTGWAGPQGGTERDPVGTVYAGFSSKEGETSERFWFRGDRDSIRTQAASVVLGHLVRRLAGE